MAKGVSCLAIDSTLKPFFPPLNPKLSNSPYIKIEIANLKRLENRNI